MMATSGPDTGEVRVVPAAGAGDVLASVVRRAQAGDGAAFAEVVRHYDPGLRGLAWRLLGDRGRMDDVLQEAYVKAFRALPRFQAGSALGTWLYRITYNACIDELRRAGRRPQPVELFEDRAAPGPGLDGRVAERMALGRALAALPEDQRAVVLLVDAQGFDYEAAAEVVGVAVGTVASRLSRARATLRIALTEVDG